MRNLKKVLSLALAMVMLLGMMVVGAGAATSFKDDSSIPADRQVAAAVANKIGVLIGDDDGNFNPDGTLTRAEAAVILARLDLGTSAASALTPTEAATFTDVAAGTGYGWAKAYIDYCAGNGYILGDGNGHFMPGSKVTSVQFAMMISRVLGYDTKKEGVDGTSDWDVKGAALARRAGLGTDVAVDSNEMTRADMAQMVLNALTAPMVEYAGLNISTDDFSYTTPATSRKHANDVGKSTDYKGDAIVPNITPIRLCEEKFPDLRLKRDSLDAFGREYSQWTWKHVGIAGSESQVEAEQTYTKRTLATTIKSDINDAKGYSGTSVWVDGVEWTGCSFMNSTWISKLTQNGRQVQVYLKDDNNLQIEKVVVVNTYAAKVNSIAKDGTDDRYVTIVTQDTNKTYPVTPVFGEDENKDLVLGSVELGKLDKTFETSDFAAGDVVSYTAAWNEDNEVYEIQEMTKLEIAATATLEKWVGKGLLESSAKGEAESNFTAGGQKYDYSVNNAIVSEYGEYTENRIASFTAGKSEINIYLDEYDYVIYVSGVEAVKNYATVIGVGKTNQYGSETRGVTLLMPDGTTQEVIAKMSQSVWNSLSSKKVGSATPTKPADLTKGFDDPDVDTENLYKDGVGDVVSYTVGDKDVYTLTPATQPTNYFHTYTDMGGSKVSFTNGKSAITITDKAGKNDTLYTTSKTIFMIGSPNGDSWSYSSFIGYANAPTIDTAKKEVYGVSYVTNSYYTNQIDAIYINVEGVVAPTNYIYFVKAKNQDITTTDIGSYSLPAVVDGEITTIEIQSALSNTWNGGETPITLEAANPGLYVIYEVEKDSNGIIVGCTIANLSTVFDLTNGKATGTIQRVGETLGFGLAGKSPKWGAYNNNTKVYYINENYTEITSWDVDTVPTDRNDEAYASLTNDGDRKLANVFIKEVEGNTEVKPTTYEVKYQVEDGEVVTETEQIGKTHTITCPKDIDTAKVGDENVGTIEGNKLTVTQAEAEKGTIVITLKETITTGKTYTLTLTGILNGTGNSVEVGGKLLTPVNGVYTIKENADVKVWTANANVATNLNGKTLQIDGVSVTFTSGVSSAPSTMTFKMTNNLELGMIAADTILGTPDEVVTITLNGNVTATYKAPGATEAVAVVSGEPVKKGGELTITSKGTGTGAAAKLNIAGNTTASATQETNIANVSGIGDKVLLDGSVVKALDGSVTLYSVNLVKTNGNGVKADGKIGTSSVTVGANVTTGVWVPVGVEMTVSGGSFDGYVISTDANVLHTAAANATTKFTMNDSKTVNVYGAYQVNIGKGVKASYADSASNDVDLKDGDLVKADEDVTLNTGTDADKVVVADKAGKGYGKQVGHTATAAPITQGEKYVAYTKVTVTADIASFNLPADKFGKPVLENVAAAGDYGFAEETEILVTGSNDGKHIAVTAGGVATNADAADATTKVAEVVGGTQGAAAKGTAEIKVAARAISLAEAT